MCDFEFWVETVLIKTFPVVFSKCTCNLVVFSNKEYHPICWNLQSHCLTQVGVAKEQCFLFLVSLSGLVSLSDIDWYKDYQVPNIALINHKVLRIYLLSFRTLAYAHPLSHHKACWSVCVSTNLRRTTWPSSTGKWPSPPPSPSSTSSPPSYRHSNIITMPYSPPKSESKSWPWPWWLSKHSFSCLLSLTTGADSCTGHIVFWCCYGKDVVIVMKRTPASNSSNVF